MQLDDGITPRVTSIQRVKKRKHKPMDHVPNGFPHMSSIHNGYCICVDECCQSEESGCVCKHCVCHDPGKASHYDIAIRTIITDLGGEVISHE